MVMLQLLLMLVVLRENDVEWESAASAAAQLSRRVLLIVKTKTVCACSAAITGIVSYTEYVCVVLLYLACCHIVQNCNVSAHGQFTDSTRTPPLCSGLNLH